MTILRNQRHSNTPPVTREALDTTGRAMPDEVHSQRGLIARDDGEPLGIRTTATARLIRP